MRSAIDLARWFEHEIRRLYASWAGDRLARNDRVQARREDRIMKRLEAGPLSREDVRVLLGGRVSAEVLSNTRDRLVALGSICLEKLETPGRSAELWRLIE